MQSCRMSFVILIMLFVSNTTKAQHKKARVLFIGNSYTAVNDLPKLVSNMAASTGDTLEYDMSAPGGVTFWNHIDPYATSYIFTLQKLRQGGWDYVVLQEQSMNPATPPEDYYRACFPYAKFLVDTVRKYNPCAEVIFYMTWGRKNGLPVTCTAYPNWQVYCTYVAMDSVIRERYLELADFNKGSVSPVGPVWRYIRNHYPGIELYEPDESHPSAAGSYAGACSFYTAIFKKPAALITYNFSLSAQIALNIRTAAVKVVYDSLDAWRIGHYETIAGFNYNANSLMRVSFTNKSANAIRHNWNFGDGQTSTAVDPVHTYSSAGVYTARLISTGAKCSDTTYARVNTALDPNTTMFTVSPNPVPDKLYITSALFGRDNYQIQLVNSMGQLVYNQRASGEVTQSIDVLGLPKGFYTLRISTTKRIYRKKIIIN